MRWLPSSKLLQRSSIIIPLVVGPAMAIVCFAAEDLATTALAQTSQSQPVSTPPDPFASHKKLGRDRTVFIVMTLDCLGLASGTKSEGAQCRDSVPFYKGLAALPRMDGEERRIVVFVARGVAPAGQALKSLGFNPHTVTSGPSVKTDGFPVFRPVIEDLIKEVPTLVVLDGRGQRLGTWTGRLSGTQEREVIQVITGGKRP